MSNTKITVTKRKTKLEKLRALLVKYYDIIAYLFFGVATTIVNIFTYYIFAHVFHVDTTASTAIGQIVSIIFAYLTNRKWVFKSKASGAKEIAAEAAKFFSARGFTFVLDLLIMYIFVKKMGMPDMIIKVASNILIIALNYIASKLLIFTKR